MTHKTVERLLVVVGLGLLLVVGVALPLRLVRAAPSTYAGVGAPEAAVFTVALPSPTPTPTVTLPPGQPPAPTVTLTPQGAVSPTEALSPTLVSTPTETFTPTPTSTSTPTPAPPPTQKPGQGGAPATTEAPPATPLPTDTAAPTATPAPIAKPTVPPTPSVSPTSESPLPPEITALLGDRGPLVIGGCLVLLIFALGMLLILLAFRRKKPKPVPSPPTPPRPEAAPGAYLESLDTAGGSRRFALKPGGISIGRAPDNEVVITQDFPGWDTVSRHHARVYQWEGYWVVDDQGSMNGVWVSGRRTGHNILKDGWHLRFGGVGFVFHTGEAAQ